MAISDCLWGVLDGINEHGLAISLSFGGRKVIARGFGIMLILRYILEICQTTREVMQVLRRVPVQMAYNLAIADRSGRYATAFIAPDREPIVVPTLASANHQERVEWRPEHERVWETGRRQAILETCLRDPRQTLAGLMGQFFQPPVYRVTHPSGWSTLYTSLYYPETGEMECRWPNHIWCQSFDAFVEGERRVYYREHGYSVCY
jgi:predicted choloylglycine hydrolase